MGDVTKYKNGYEKYSEIIRSVMSKCNDSNFVGKVKEVSGNFSTTMEHFLLDNGLHVYIDEETIKISNDELYFVDSSNKQCYADEKINVLFEMNERLKRCRIYISGRDIIEGIHVAYNKEDRYIYDLDENARDDSFLPTNIDPWDGNKPRKRIEDYQDLPDDMKSILEDAIARAENSETARVYSEALKLHDKVVSMANRDYKENLIAQIRREQQEGKVLDAKIRDAQNRTQE